MENDVIGETADGRFRVILARDESASPPEHDGQGWVYLIESRYGTRAFLQPHTGPTGDSTGDDLAGAIARALDNWRGRGLDWDLLDRYLRMFWGVVATDRFDADGDAYLEVVTDAMCDEWGIPAGAPIRAEAANLSDWRAYVEGDVYGYTVQERVTWSSDGREDREVWEDTDDSCWGFYGYDYAVESAREALASVSA